MHHSEKGRSLTQDFEHSLDGQEAASSSSPYSTARWTKKKEREIRGIDQRRRTSSLQSGLATRPTKHSDTEQYRAL